MVAYSQLMETLNNSQAWEFLGFIDPSIKTEK